MSLTTKYLSDENIVIEIADSTTTVEDFFSHNDTSLLDYVNQQAPEIVHIVIDLTEMQWDFPSFMRLSKNAADIRKSGQIPQNIKQYFVGTDAWINNWRSMMQKQFGEETYVFASVDLALDYIRNQE